MYSNLSTRASSSLVLPVGSLLLVLLAIFTPIDVAAQTSLSVTIRDTRDASPIIGAAIECSIGSAACNLEATQAGRFESKKPFRRTNELIHLSIQPGNSYAERKAAIRGSRLASGTSLLIYVARKFPQYTYKYLDNGLPYHSRGEFDRALAYYEVAYFSSEPATSGMIQFDINLKYNYARSIANACLRAGYDTCSDAKTLYQRLIDDEAKYPSLFRRERIDSAELRKTIRDIDAMDTVRRYASFKTLFNSREYADAAREGENMIDQFDQRPEAFANARLTKDRLKEDVGVAYFRASANPAVADDSNEKKQLLDNSFKHYSTISNKSPRLAIDIRTVEQRIAEVK